jgi:ribonuclease P protein subunit RPR2
VDALLPWPCGPLELLETVEVLVNGEAQLRLGATSQPQRASELLAYADDLRRLLEIERGQRALMRQAYHQSVEVLATALATKDTGTRAHSHRVQRYARHLAAAIAGDHAVNSSLDCGFLLHDVGKIGIPDSILLKPGPLTPSEQRVMQTHTILGEQMVSDIPLVRGAGLGVVRSHHERWDGQGYPDRMSGENIPLGARVFAIADALDAMTTERPYRRSSSWSDAVTQITAQRGLQFDPRVVDAFAGIEGELHDIYLDLAAA